jgi:cation diffusion facilitator family transporter
MSPRIDIQEKALKTVRFSLFGNVLLAIIKGAAGIFGNSFALIADAIESTTDVFASFLVWFGIRYSSRPADANHPYGHGRAETLITFIVVGFLIITATAIAIESIHNIQTPHDAPEPFTLMVLGAIVIWKEISYRLVLKRGKETNSTSLMADAWHHRSDAITSIAAFIGISIALIGGEGFQQADDWAALFASGFIFYNSYLIFRPALGEIMDEHSHDDLIENIRRHAADVEGVVDTEKCFVRKTGMFYLVDLHVEVDGQLTVAAGHDIAHRLKDHLLERLPEITDVLIHIEPAANLTDGAQKL